MAGNLVSDVFRNVNNTQTVINTKLSNNINEQHNAVKWEAQLVQRDRATPRVIGNLLSYAVSAMINTQCCKRKTGAQCKKTALARERTDH